MEVLFGHCEVLFSHHEVLFSHYEVLFSHYDVLFAIMMYHLAISSNTVAALLSSFSLFIAGGSTHDNQSNDQ